MTELTSIKTNIMQQVEEAATQERKEMAATNHPTAMKVLGVTVPALKAVLKSMGALALSVQ